MIAESVVEGVLGSGSVFTAAGEFSAQIILMLHHQNIFLTLVLSFSIVQTKFTTSQRWLGAGFEMTSTGLKLRVDI